MNIHGNDTKQSNSHTDTLKPIPINHIIKPAYFVASPASSELLYSFKHITYTVQWKGKRH